jgi:NAD(P)-dependent dehydrogenase (short-subunit alcohol dehydrogenase family)
MISQTTTKIAIVTGGSRGRGRNTVLSVAKRGVDSIFTYNSNREAADKVVGQVRETGRNAAALQLGTSNLSDFDPFVHSLRRTLAERGAKGFDFLVNNASAVRVARNVRVRIHEGRDRGSNSLPGERTGPARDCG